MADAILVRCAACGATNRVPRDKVAAGLHPRCGRCKQHLAVDLGPMTVTDTTFAPKMAFIPIGVMAILYFSVSDSVWNVKAGEDAPLSAKWVASLVLLSWIGVIMGGRLLPYV